MLASCGSGARARVWLVRWDGQSPAALSPAGSAASSYGPYTGAWRLSGTLYVNRAAGARCPSMASGPGTSGFYSAERNGALRSLAAPGGTQATVVGMDADALLLLACTGSSGGSGLMVYYVNAPPAAPIWLQRGTSGQAGVVAAVPFDQPGVVEAVPYTP